MCEDVTMIVWSVLRKLIQIPIIVALTLIEWCGIFLTGMANAIINLIAILLLVIAGLSALTGLASGAECLRFVGIAIGAVIVCNLLICMVGVIGAARRILTDYL